jgi:transcriptional regulator with GAF, ATPase, and Fis domain/Tfp pilus assembly protein PilF
VSFHGYKLLRPVQEGSHARIYRAEREGQPFALKIYNEEAPPAVRREGEVLAKILHPNVVRFVESGRETGRDYLVTEWVEAPNLDEIPRPSDLGILLQAVRGLLSGLEEIHRQGWVHGDLKGSNVLFLEGNIKIIDLGLAQSLKPEQATPPAGTLAYLAPELIFGQAPRPASDLYSLGVILWKWLHGSFPFPLVSASAVIHWHLFDTPLHPCPDLNFVPEGLIVFLFRLLAKNPQDRFPSAAAAQRFFERMLQDQRGWEDALGEEAGEAETGFEILGEAIRFYEAKDARTEEEKLTLAELYYRQGYPEKALQESSGIRQDAAHILQAKILTRMGKFPEARKILASYASRLDALGQAERISVLNTWGIVEFYLGNFEAAEKFFARAEERARAEGGREIVAVSYNNLGNLLLERGKIAEAEIYFRRAVEEAREAGDRIHEGMFLLSLGYFHQRSDQPEEALPYYAKSLEILDAVGQRSEAARARLNRATLLMGLGDLAGAERDLHRAQAGFRAHALEYLTAYSTMVRGDLERRQGDRESSLRSFQEAEDKLGLLKRAADVQWARLHRLEVLVETSRHEDADKLLQRLEADTELAKEPRARAHLNFLKARHLWSRGATDEQVAAAFMAAEDCLSQAGDEEARLLFHYAWGSFLFQKGRHSEARTRLLAALEGLENRAGRLPKRWRKNFLKNSPKEEIERMLGMETLKIPHLASSSDRIFSRELEELQTELIGELDMAVLAEKILDRMIQLTSAERGFILLKEKPSPRIAVARNIDQAELKGSEEQISWSLAEEVLQKGKALVTVDALMDERFSLTASIHALKLRSILCLPFKKGEEILGAIYLDNRQKAGAFQASLANALQPFADLIGQALDNARRFTEMQGKLREAKKQLQAAEAELKIKYDYQNIVGRHHKMLEVFKILDRVTDVEVPVLILGESGSGKEQVAKAIHFNGPRASRPFVSINCQAIPEGLFESEVFGHARGAFTGAVMERIGLIEQAHRGTLFLDEIGDMPAGLQGKLLRVLQEGKFRRVGDKQERDADCRVLTATHHDLRAMIQEGKFREDLWYRLNVVEIQLPPLRERMEDLPLLVDHFLEEFARRHQTKKKRIHPRALTLLSQYSWPGNVRELENTISNACVFSEGKELTPDAFRYKRELWEKRPGADALSAGEAPALPSSLREGLQTYEKKIITQALQVSKGNITHAAIALKVARPQLSRMIKKYKVKT